MPLKKGTKMRKKNLKKSKRQTKIKPAKKHSKVFKTHTDLLDEDKSDSQNTIERFPLLNDRLPINEYRYYFRIDRDTINRMTRKPDGTFLRELIFYPRDSSIIDAFRESGEKPRNWYEASIAKLINEGNCILGKYDSSMPDIPFEYTIPSAPVVKKIKRHSLKKIKSQGNNKREIKRFKLNTKKETTGKTEEKPKRIKLKKQNNSGGRKISSNKNKIQPKATRFQLQRH